MSPHLDDAVLSVGAAAADHVRRGGAVTVLTVLAGDPHDAGACGRWDARAGFADAGSAARARRSEDLAACRVLGAAAVHVDDVDEQYPRRLPDDDLWARLAPHLLDADEVLVPGRPLVHRDHAAVARLVAGRLPAGRPVRLYLEQPYAWRVGGPPPAAEQGWLPHRPSLTGVLRKARALRCYGSQLPLLGPRNPAALAGPRLQARSLATTAVQGEHVTAALAPADALRHAVTDGPAR